MTVQEMLRTHPSSIADADTISHCIEECFACAQSCTACADACLGEEQVAQLTRCIRLNLDCADVCEATGKIVSRQTQPQPELVRTMVQACAEACPPLRRGVRAPRRAPRALPGLRRSLSPLRAGV